MACPERERTWESRALSHAPYPMRRFHAAVPVFYSFLVSSDLSGCTVLRSRPQPRTDPVTLYPRQHLVLSVSFFNFGCLARYAVVVRAFEPCGSVAGDM